MPPNLFDFFPPRPARMHEACGPGAYGFAGMLAAALSGNVLWVAERWRPEQINPLGINDFIDPSRILTAMTKDHPETLAITEEALRSGAVALVVAEVTAPLSLTAGRRLQLACETGKTTGLCLIPEGMGSNAAESRWRCAPVFDPADSTRQHWEIIKNKSGTTEAWNVRWDKSARRVHVVPPVGQRPGSQGMPD